MGRSGKNKKSARLFSSGGTRELRLDRNVLVGFEEIKESLLENQDLIRDHIYDDQFLNWLENFQSDNDLDKEDAHFRALEMFLYLGFETEPSSANTLKR